MAEVVAGVVAAAVYAAVFFALFGTFMKRQIAVPRDAYVREPPSTLAPALVGTLFANFPWGETLSATLLDLVRQGVLTMQDAGLREVHGEYSPATEDHALHLDRSRCSSLQPFEWHLVWLLFDVAAQGADEVRVHQLRGWFESDAKAVLAFTAWWTAVQEASAREGLLRQGYRHAIAWASLYVMAGVFGSLLLGFFTPTPLAVAMLVFLTSIALEWPRRKMVALTASGARLQADYRRFGNYLEDFGRFHEKTPESVALWDRYLPLALVLGKAEHAFRDLYVTPPAYNGRGAPHWEARGGPRHDRSLTGDEGAVTQPIDVGAFRRWWADLKGSPW
jgi:hypothetical protein